MKDITVYFPPSSWDIDMYISVLAFKDFLRETFENGILLGNSAVDVYRTVSVYGMNGILVGEQFNAPAQEKRICIEQSILSGMDVRMSAQKSGFAALGGIAAGGMCERPRALVSGTDCTIGICAGGILTGLQKLRCRKLYEMDPETLADFDDTNLETLYYTVLEE